MEYKLIENQLKAEDFIRLLDYIAEHTEEGNFTSVGLTAAEGKEGFYERFGFSKSRGMTKYIER